VKLTQQLEVRLADLRDHGLLRELRRVDSPQGTRIQVAGRTLLNFSSNDYLGLANHPALKEAAIRAVREFGAGAGASRLICGSLSPFHELEEALADFKGTEAALTFSTGYAAALGTITALLGKEDIIIVDKLVHACIVDAARLSGAKIRVFKHNDLDDLERILKWAVAPSPSPQRTTRNVLIVTESVFSMDGDCAPLREIVALKERYGASLMVDEAHATGLYGERGQGLASQLGVADRVEIQMGTLGKALGVSGGYIAGSRKLVDYLVNRARSFVFSTAPPPAVAAAALAAVKHVPTPEGRMLCETLWANVRSLTSRLAPCTSHLPSAIVPLIIGGEAEAVELSATLRERGFFVPAIRYPTVARGTARLRLTLTAAHTPDEVVEISEALTKLQIVNRKS
jgi:8-amino-7-oxononanoate synthase